MTSDPMLGLVRLRMVDLTDKAVMQLMKIRSMQLWLMDVLMDSKSIKEEVSTLRLSRDSASQVG